MASPCCVAGHIATGTPKGEVIKIGDVDAYVAKPQPGNEKAGKAVVIATDVFGFAAPNCRLVADSIAEQGGYLCVVPDLFNGVYYPLYMMEKGIEMVESTLHPPEGLLARAGMYLRLTGSAFSFVPATVRFWMHNPPSRVVKMLQALLPELRKDYNLTKVGLSGYCYGGIIGIDIGKTKDHIHALAVAHGVIMKNDDLKLLQVPSLFVFAEHDTWVNEKSRKACEDILDSRTDLLFRHKYYPGTIHGFAMRGNDKVPEVHAAKEDAFQEMIKFFAEAL